VVDHCDQSKLALQPQANVVSARRRARAPPSTVNEGTTHQSMDGFWRGHDGLTYVLNRHLSASQRDALPLTCLAGGIHPALCACVH
jgi:hypothetical protein